MKNKPWNVKTTEQFVEEAKLVADLDYSKVEYVNGRIHVDVRCEKHNYNFKIAPNAFLRGVVGCKHCSAEKYRQKKELQLITKGAIVHKGKFDYSKTIYNGAKTHCIFICPRHGEFSQSPTNHLSGYGCTKCAHEDTVEVMDVQVLIDKFNIIYGDRYAYSNIGYTKAKELINIGCSVHGDFQVLSSNFLKGRGCPKCDTLTSRAEKAIGSFIEEKINIVVSDRKLIKPYELDIVAPSKKVAIEYNGIYWHSDKHLDNKYHLNKTNMVEKLGYQLIHIFSDEWKNKPEIVKSRLLHIIGKTPRKIYARKTVIKNVSTKESMLFLEENHIQGKLGSKVKLGLYVGEELVSLMTFGGLRRNLGRNTREGSFELLRFCNKINTTVIGGASKLFKHFEKTLHPKEVISYADRRWSKGVLYDNLGFKFIKNTSPNYFYVKSSERLGRYNFRKSELIKEGFDFSKTEKEIMEERGYSRIYDCGTKLFQKIYK